MGLLLASGSSKPTYPYDMWYGVKGSFSSKDYKLERVGNLDLHKTLPIQKKLKRYVENNLTGAVKYYLNANDSRKKDGGAAAIIDSTDGNVMLEKPEYYLRVEIDVDSWIYAISEYPLPGFVKKEKRAIAPWFSTIDLTNNIAVSGCFLTWNGDEVARGENGLPIFTTNAAQFRGGNGSSHASWDDTYRSQLGMARTNISKATVRPLCKNGTHHGAFRTFNEIAWLQRIEYASLHSQDAYTTTLTIEGYHQGGLGNGCTWNSSEWNSWASYYPFIPSGVTAPLGNNTGKVNFDVTLADGNKKTFQVTSYRGLEVPFEYLWMLADDVLIRTYPDTDKALTEAYLCEDYTKFTSPSDNATTVPNGYELIAELPRATDYILREQISKKGYAFPSAIGGSANTGWCDSFYSPGVANSGWYGALLSAHAGDGACAGFGTLGADVRSSYTYATLGFRLCRD